MTTGTPAPTGLALACYERPVGVNPPLNYPAYRSTALRAPRRPLQVMPQGLTEVTGPLLGFTKAPTCSCACPTMPSIGAIRRVKPRLILAFSTVAS